MGYGIASSAIRGGHTVWGSDINPEQNARLIRDGAEAGPLEAGALEAVIVVVLNAAQTGDVLFGCKRYRAAIAIGRGRHVLRHGSA